MTNAGFFMADECATIKGAAGRKVPKKLRESCLSKDRVFRETGEKPAAVQKNGYDKGENGYDKGAAEDSLPALAESCPFSAAAVYGREKPARPGGVF